MPKETFYAEDIENPELAHAYAINIAWGKADNTSDIPAGVWLAGGIKLDRSEINRLIKVLRKARDQAYPHWLADYRPVPEEAFWSPGEDAIMLNGETYVRANPEEDRALLAEWRTSMEKWQKAVRDWEKHTAELEEARRRPIHVKPIPPAYLYDM